MASRVTTETRSGAVAGATSSSSSDESSSTLPASDTLSASASDTCFCAVNATGAAPRSCYACVNVALLTGEQCAIAPSGDCVAAAEAKAQYESSSLASYANSTSSYCDQDDSVCNECRAVWDQELSRGLSVDASSASPRVCVGSGGCVCLAVCEAFHVANVTCSVTTTPSTMTTAPAISPTLMDTSNTAQPIGGYAWLFVVLALFVLMSVWSYRQTHVDENGYIRTSYRQLFRGRKKRQVPVAPRPPLSGWREYRERLIEKERAVVAGGKPSTRRVLTQNGPDLTVLPGDGYRPLSPSHASHQQQHAVMHRMEAH